MIPQELIDTDLGIVLAALGKPVRNAALWREILGENAPTEEAILAKWDQWKAERQAQKEAADSYNAVLSQGYDTGLGFKLSIGEASQTRMDLYAAHLDRKAAAGQVSDSTMIPIVDKDDVVHSISYSQFKTLLIPFGDTCQGAYFLKP